MPKPIVRNFRDNISYIGSESKEPIVVVMGNGTLAAEYVRNLVDMGKDFNEGVHIVWYARDFKKLEGQIRDIMTQSGNQKGITGSIVSTVKGAPDEASFRVYRTLRSVKGSEDGTNPAKPERPLALIGISGKSLDLLEAILPHSGVVYFAIGQSEVRTGLAGNGAPVDLRDREKLLLVNAQIVADFAPIVGKANNALHIVTTNPDNVIAKIYRQVAGLPQDQVITVGPTLDTTRLHSMIREIGIYAQIEGARVLGNHGPDMIFPDWDKVKIDGIPFPEFFDVLLRDSYGADKGIASAQDMIADIERRTRTLARDIVDATGQGTRTGPSDAAIEATLASFLSNPVIVGAETPEGLYGTTGSPVMGHPAILKLVPTGSGLNKKVVELAPMPMEPELNEDQLRQWRASAARLHEMYMRPEVQDIIARALEKSRQGALESRAVADSASTFVSRAARSANSVGGSGGGLPGH